MEFDSVSLKKSASSLYTIIRSFSSYIPLYIKISFEQRNNKIYIKGVEIISDELKEDDKSVIIFVSIPNHKVSQKCLQDVIRKVVLEKVSKVQRRKRTRSPKSSKEKQRKKIKM